MLLFSISIFLVLAVYCKEFSCFPTLISILSTHCNHFYRNFSAFDFFHLLVVFSSVLPLVKISSASHCILFTFFISCTFLFLLCNLSQIWVSSLCAIRSLLEFSITLGIQRSWHLENDSSKYIKLYIRKTSKNLKSS